MHGAKVTLLNLIGIVKLQAAFIAVEFIEKQDLATIFYKPFAICYSFGSCQER